MRKNKKYQSKIARKFPAFFGTYLIFTLLCLQSCTEEPQVQFSLVEAEASNISFANDLLENDTLNYFSYPYMYMGGGVSAGDINNDGLIDLFFTSNMKPNALYLNKGDLEFQDITVPAGVAGDDRWFTGTTMVDINGDRLLDLYVSVSGKGEKRQNLLYINNGDLTFTESAAAYGIADNGHSTNGTFFDYDNDGDLDLYVANYPPTSFKSPVAYYRNKINNPTLEDSDILYRNNSDGTFTNVTKQAGVLNFGLSLSATVSDVNQDGWKDIYVSNDFDSPDFLYLNNQDGTFREVSQSSLNHTAQYGMGADIADYNNDGLMDIGQVDMTPEDNRRSKANMSSMNPRGFQNMIDAGLHYQYMQNCLQLNRGNDQAENPVYSELSRLAGISTTDWSWAILFCDLDNDGLKDIYISNGTRRDINNRDYFLDLQSRNKFGGVALTQAEIDKIPAEKISNYIYKNNGDLTFENVVEEWGANQLTFSNGAAYADLDNDGDLDYVVNNIDQEASVFRNNNLETNNFISVSLQGPDHNTLGIGATVKVVANGNTQVQELSLTRGFQSSVSPVLHFGLRKAETIDLIEVTWPDGKVVSLREEPANQRLVVDHSAAAISSVEQPAIATLFREENPAGLGIDFVHRENNSDDYRNEPLLPYETSKMGATVAVADVNNDQLDDVYFGGAAGQTSQLYLQQADGTFTKMPDAPWAADAASEDMAALFFDSDGDGDVDLYTVSGGNEFQRRPELLRDRLYINDGEGNFTKSIDHLPAIESSGSRVISADYDQDGDLDLFVGGKLHPGQYPWPTKSYLLENNEGRFTDRTEELAPELINAGMINDASWTDYDGDGAPDLVLVGEWTPIMFFRNQDGRFENETANVGLADTEGWWFSISATDLDQDGDQDFLVGNLGLNYKYQATPAEPFEVFADDFDGNNRKDIVLSYYNFGKLFPVRGKSCSSQQIPALKKKFKGYDAFAISEVTDVYGEEELKNAEIHYLAKTFASAYLENNGAGQFNFVPLPNEAQFSSVNKILQMDVDADGTDEALLAGNLYAAEIETPRNDAGKGSLLRYGTNGSFLPVSSRESGLYLDGDVKDMALITVGGRKAVVVGRNDQSPQLIYLDEK